MNHGTTSTTGHRIQGLLVVLAGIIFFQSLLYGPALIGKKILLPLDILAMPGIDIPPSPATAGIIPHDIAQSDLISQFEPARQFAVSEIQAGRFPWWGPFQYAGAPFVWPKFSPFMLLEYTTHSPVILAWVQLVSAIVAGLGMYMLGRRLLHISFWPAAICGWLYPLTTVFIIWYGTPTRFPVCWLPWIFVAIDQVVRKPNGLSVICLAVTTGLLFISGNIDIAGQVMLASGFYALWCLWDEHGTQIRNPRLWRAVGCLITAWALGIMLATPHILPLVSYAKTGSRMLHRGAGGEERPPIGLAALPQIVMPDFYGNTTSGSCLLQATEGNFFESPSIGYAGIFAALLLAPLAWANPSRRLNWFWCGLAFFGLTWCMNIPGFVQLLRLPGLNMMSHNRLVFLTGFAVFALAATGLENIRQGLVQPRRWFWCFIFLFTALGGWCAFRAIHLPEPVATQLTAAARPGLRLIGDSCIGSVLNVPEVQNWFRLHYGVTAAMCAIGVAMWLSLSTKRIAPTLLLPVLAVLLAGDLLWFAHGRCAECDPALYYPRIPALDQVRNSTPGRFIALNCLPSTLLVMQGLNDLRGYDAIDPALFVTLAHLGGDDPDAHDYAGLQVLNPKMLFLPTGDVRLAPVLDMLNVRYVVTTITPETKRSFVFRSDGYCVLINSNALPRVFVPRSVETVARGDLMLTKIASADFDPAAVAYVPTPPSPILLPPDCHGTAEITNEVPTHIMVSVTMQTPGMVVLSDRWDSDWEARWNNQAVDILRANYAIRGVILPAGSGTLEFIYHPASLALGCDLAAFAGIILLLLLLRCRRAAAPAALKN